MTSVLGSLYDGKVYLLVFLVLSFSVFEKLPFRSQNFVEIKLEGRFFNVRGSEVMNPIFILHSKE